MLGMVTVEYAHVIAHHVVQIVGKYRGDGGLADAALL